MPSHHTSPSSVSATLVKTELPHSVFIALALVCSPVPGATPKKPASGLIAYSRPSSPKRIQAMSSPMVSTVQPGMVGSSIARLVLPQARRERGGDVLGPRRCGGRELEDEHVLGEPALVAGHDGGDAQRVALLAEQRVAAVAGAVGPDLAGLGEVRDVLGGVARPRHVRLALGAAGRRRVCTALTKKPSVAELVEDRLAHAGHGAHGDGDVGGVGDLDADRGERRAERAHAERARRTSCGRASQPRKMPLSPPVKISRISAGAFQWLVGPASSSFSEQMKVRSSTRATSARVGGRVVGVRALDRVELA